ncbi:uncharacterized protein N7496_006656 [Penicillium cataractarum]|uniref:Uncharacterized protein n=1 Tax=Penicillium cataractarum TaxID=2100454 RepID=A0A9W9S4N8_9EURO|nr:uncharacterized protein N7496_006656 [Penicillium cataractarum]KAJ5370564.1 hypothetical protein N7496_006656 [Penicillium cataractarum]
MHTSYVSLVVFAMGAAAVPNLPKAAGNPFEGSFPFMPSGSSSVEDGDSMSNPVPAYMAAMQAVEEAQAGEYNNPAPTQQAVPSSMPFQETPVAQPAAPKPESDGNQEFDAPMAQPSAPSLNNPIPEIPDYAVPSSMSSVVAHVKPSPAFSAVYEYSSSMSIMVSVPASSSMAPIVIVATPAPESMPVEMAPITINPMPVQSIVQTPIAKPSSFTTRPILKASANIHGQHLASMAASSSVMHATPSSSATPTPSAHVVDDPSGILSKVPLLSGLLSGLGLA